MKGTRQQILEHQLRSYFQCSDLDPERLKRIAQFFAQLSADGPAYDQIPSNHPDRGYIQGVVTQVWYQDRTRAPHQVVVRPRMARLVTNGIKGYIANPHAPGPLDPTPQLRFAVV